MTERKSLGEELAAADDEPVARATSPSLATLWQRRIGRRDVLAGFGKAALLASVSPAILSLAACGDSYAPDDIFGFEEVPRGVDETHHIAADHNADVLIRWGDPVLPNAPPFDIANQSAAAQLRQFGYNNDYIGFVPLPLGSNSSDRGLLCIHHEYTNDNLMHAGMTAEDPRENFTREIVEISMAAHGGTIVEVARGKDGKWLVVRDSEYNRRITPLTTDMTISGPAAGHPRLQTGEDPTGHNVIGTINNCAGGITPWGTWLMSEENFNFYFIGEPADEMEAANHARMGFPAGRAYPWGLYHKRFDLSVEPKEPNRYGWVVEVDPLDPFSTPVKRTALGRFKHEGCENAATKDGRLVIYMGDDQQFEYLYKFITAGKVDSDDRAASASLLDEGTLYVARFEEDGSGKWMPLVHGKNGLDAANGFASQADVLIETRRAADLVGATPLDRPEDVEPNPATGKIYVALTNSKERRQDQVDGVNPRAANLWGQIVEMEPGDGDHGSENFTWTLIVKCGEPRFPAIGAAWHPDIGENGWFTCPDNMAVDPKGRLWVATDQGSGWDASSGSADGLYALATVGEKRGLARRIFRAPIGAEVCGPCFTPDGTTLFLAVQHPGADGTKNYKGFERDSTFEDPATRWPDFEPGMPPRPSLLVITAKNGGPVGA
ncbi:PhoX family phosphatase [Parvibaculum sp.]|uniref:PhoX family protein n=1 Tax=Parvibaculum sp. TaxID=2024848 RepID=UPI002730458E|nr:PhoX family phosphatase [Parvibaculum sp.]MDP1627179.1 PhoX family phosphatase [Parvibaculum sp.]MDP2148885.1 PhoX family phosphatase [Parvibaculum sp.]MDP3329878.1 PhoX family phosphatase [Parvibaculum sp.]